MFSILEIYCYVRRRLGMLLLSTEKPRGLTATRILFKFCTFFTREFSIFDL